jgi:uncharacterized protein (TIGR01741 family)
MLEQQLNSLYHQIAQQVGNLIPEEWQNVILYAECSFEHRKAHFYYYPTKSPNPICGTNIFEIFSIDEFIFDSEWRKLVHFIGQLHQTFIDHGQEPWTNLTMHFDSNGKFSIDYHYDDFTDIDAYTRLLLWEHMIAQVPLNDSYEIKTVNEYVDYLQKRNWLYNNRPVQRIEQ